MGERRFRRYAALLVAAALAGCAQVPTHGPIQQGQEVGLRQQDSFVRRIAEPPPAGADPVRIVRGFLAASSNFDGNHAVAREYLAPEANATWDPGAGVQVYDARAATFVQRAGGRVALQAPRGGSIDAEGSYTPAAPGAAQEADFTLRQVGGQWRIAGLPNGLLLSVTDVARAYRQVYLYYLDPSRTRLVPDPVLLPVRDSLASAAVRALLAGPTRRLRGAVATAFPPGTRLVSGTVPVVGNVARVDLTGAVQAAAPGDREALSAQLVWTLRTLPEVRSVAVTSEGVDLSVPGMGATQPRDAWARFDPAVLPVDSPAYAVRDGRLGTFAQDAFGPLQGAVGTGQAPLVAPAVSPDGTLVAGLSADRSGLLLARVGPGEPVRPLAVPGSGPLTAPSFDFRNTLWVARQGGTGPLLWAVPPGSAPQAVDAPELAGSPVVALRVARDGVRLAVVVRRGGVPTLLVGVVVREPSGRLRATGFQPVAPGFVDVRDVVWQDAVRLAVLGAVGDQQLQPYVLAVDGETRKPTASLAGIVSIAAGPADRLLAATSQDGRDEVWEFVKGAWQKLGQASWPTFRG